MSFGTTKEDQKFVNIYGLLVGFLVIQREELHEQENMLQLESQNVHKVDDVQKKRKRLVIDRTECPTRVSIKLKKDRWIITIVDLTHNHEMVSSPSLTKSF